LPNPEQQAKGTLLPVGREMAFRAMAERGLTITELAVRLGISRKHASNLLHGRVPLGDSMAERLAQALGFDEGELADLRHDGVIPPPLATIPPMRIRLLADPTEPIEDWAEP
jgi:transcriptional regulator with XRE-family HTH domain